MATSKSVPAGGSGVDGVLSLLNAFGQQSTTKGTANTNPLEDILKNLQGSPDGNKLLETIFQQASAQIPKFQTAFSNAVGARSGGNSSVQSALSELLKQTTLAGQQQLATQQQNNQQLQVQAANGLAQATRGQTQTTQPNLGLGAKVIAGLQGANEVGKLFDKGKKLWSGADTASGALNSGGSLLDSGLDFSSSVGNIAPVMNDLTSSLSLGDAGSSFANIGDWITEAAPSLMSTAGELGSAVADGASEGGSFLGDAWAGVKDWFGFADGGLVGRDGDRKLSSKYQERSAKATNPDTKEMLRFLAAYPINYENLRLSTQTFGPPAGDASVMAALENGLSDDILAQLVPLIEQAGRQADASKQRETRGAVRGYADGGIVRAGGGRRSSAPTYTKDAVTPTMALNSGSLSSPIKKPGTIVGASGSSDLSIFNPTGSGGYSNLGDYSAGLSGYNITDGSRPTGNDVVGSGSTSTGIPNWAIGAVASLIGVNPLLSFALKQGNNYLTSIDPTNPSSANAINGSDSESDNAMKNVSHAPVAPTEGPSRGNIDFAAESGGGPQSPSDLLGWFQANNGGSSDNFGVGNFTDYSGGSYSGTNYSGGGWFEPAVVESHANGGKVQGPGTGTSDSVPAMLSKDEYIISADVVKKLGVDFFDNLQKLHHTPAGKAA